MRKRRKANKPIAQIRPYPITLDGLPYALDERLTINVIQPLMGELGWSYGPVLSVNGRRSGWHLDVNGGKTARLTDSQDNWLEIDAKAAKKLLANAEKRKPGSTIRFTGPCWEEQMVVECEGNWFRTLWAAGHPPKVTFLSEAPTTGAWLDWEAKEEEIEALMIAMAGLPEQPIFKCTRCDRWCHSDLEGNADHHRDLCDPCHEGLCVCPEVWKP